MNQNGKTIRQIADELGVSKQAVQKRIKREPLATKLSGLSATVAGTVYISVEGETLIISDFFSDNRQLIDNLKLFSDNSVAPEDNSVVGVVGSEKSINSADSQFYADNRQPSIDNRQPSIDNQTADSTLLPTTIINTLSEQLAAKDAQIAELNARLGEASAQMSDLTAALLTAQQTALAAQQTAQAAQALHAGTLQAQLGDGANARRGGFFARLFGGAHRFDEQSS